MKIGVNLLLYTTRPDESIFPTCERLKTYGFDGIEWPLFELNEQLARRIRSFSADTGLEATGNYAFTTESSPIAESEALRLKAWDDLRYRIDLCVELGAAVLCGPFVQQLGSFTGRGRTKDEWHRCVEFLRAAGEYAHAADVTLAVEYLNRFEIYFLNTAADLKCLCDQVAHPNVKGMIDSFHANIEEKDLFDPVLAIGSQLGHVHVSANDRGVPGPSRIGQWEEFFGGLHTVGYNRWLVIEAFGQYLPDLAVAARIWRPLFDDADSLCKEAAAFIRAMIQGRRPLRDNAGKFTGRDVDGSRIEPNR